MTFTLALLSLAECFYAFSFIFYLLSFSGVVQRGRRPAFTLLRVGFLLVTLHFFTLLVEQGAFTPVSRLSEVMALFAWSIAFVYLVLFIRIQSESFGLILTPILILFNGVACLTYHLPPRQLPVEFINPYFTFHIISAFLAYACFVLSFSAGVLYLIQQTELKRRQAGNAYAKLPSLVELDRLIFEPMIWGALLLVTAVGIGFLWAKTELDKFWLADPKTIAAMITIGLYLVVLYLHYVVSMRGKRVVVLSLMAFGMVIFCFIGTRFLGGSHSFTQ